MTDVFTYRSPYGLVGVVILGRDVADGVVARQAWVDVASVRDSDVYPPESWTDSYADSFMGSDALAHAFVIGQLDWLHTFLAKGSQV